MQSNATTVAQYLDELPEDRRAAIEAVRATILENLDSDFEEGMQYGMIGYYVPHRVFPAGYHCDPKQPLPFAALASQKQHMSLYLMTVYASGDEEAWFRREWEKTGKKLDMGKSCVRFRNIDDVPLDVVGDAIRRVPAKRHIESYQSSLAAPRAARPTSKSKSAPKPKPAAKPAPKPKSPTPKPTPQPQSQSESKSQSKG